MQKKKTQCMVQIKNLKSKTENLSVLYSNKKSTMIVKIILSEKITLFKLDCFVFFNKIGILTSLVPF